MKLLFTSRDIVFALVYSILLIIPDSLWIDTSQGRMPYGVLLAYNLVFYLSLSLIVCKIARWFQKIHQALYIATHTLLHLLCYGFSISNIFLYIFFNLRWDAFTFQLIHETNTRESSEFLETYLFTSECGLLVMGYILLMVIEYFAIKWSRQRSISMPWYVSMPIATLFIYNGIFFCFQNFDSTRDNANDYNTLIMRNMLWKLHLSVQQYDVEKADLDICARNQEIMAVDSCSYTSPNVVIIIGESFIKRHSSLYGYNKTTNPNLEKLRQTGNLSVFTDVITTRHGTSEAFKLFLSMACIKDSIRWCDTPLFPTLFKQAGYHVAFYSNQFVKESEKDRENATGAGFFYHPGIEPYIFNERNHSLNQFDEEMVQEYFEKHKREGFKPYNLTIFHLLGQHVSYKDRYTQEFARFSEKDYDDRKDLTNNQKREVSEYDNATLYNDYVVSTIISHYQNLDAIVIYFSDHGEECNDFRPHIGRSGDWDMIERKAGIECLRCQFDIPFIIYTSPLYQQNHPEIVKEINTALDRPFMTDDLPHLLLYLAGIHTSWYDSRHNLISPNFNTKRRRLVSRVFTDYDEFCSGK